MTAAEDPVGAGRRVHERKVREAAEAAARNGRQPPRERAELREPPSEEMIRRAKPRRPRGRLDQPAGAAARNGPGTPAPRVEPPGDGIARPAAPALAFQRFDELAAEVDAAGPRRWLIRGVWPEGDYGVLAAEQKAQKSWTAVDLAVSVATGTPWLSTFDIEAPGPVMTFFGEGGKANFVRRVRAVAESKDVPSAGLRLDTCSRVPRLTNRAHLAMLAERIAQQRPVLVVLDPLYLAAGGANGASLYDMGPVLEDVQHICQAHGAGLLVVHHFNRKPGSGAGRMSGAGPAEWGRVLMSADVKSRHTDPDTLATTVVSELAVIGGEISDRSIRVTRRIWSDDPYDLNSPLHLTATVSDESDGVSAVSGPKLTPAEAKLLEALRARAGAPATAAELVDAIVEIHGHGLKRPTVSTALNNLARAGLAEHIDRGTFTEKLWLAVDAPGPVSARVT